MGETVVSINRCATVVKGGRRFSFAALVVVGDKAGHVGYGFGKANEVPTAVEKAVREAERNLVDVTIVGHTIPHRTRGRYKASRVVLLPASRGTGVIAGATVRAVVEAAGIHDVLTKVFGSTNPINVVKATVEALKVLRTKRQLEELRGVKIG
jgi:small subunit ribosomal protein S5